MGCNPLFCAIIRCLIGGDILHGTGIYNYAGNFDLWRSGT